MSFTHAGQWQRDPTEKRRCVRVHARMKVLIEADPHKAS
jgi:hypothetical protein